MFSNEIHVVSCVAMLLMFLIYHMTVVFTIVVQFHFAKICWKFVHKKVISALSK